MARKLRFIFPNESPHEGIPLGNGNFGALIWGEHNRFHITINLQNYWNHRGEIVWGPMATYRKAKELILSCPAKQLGHYDPNLIGYEKEGIPGPTRMPMGRFDLVITAPVQDSILDMDHGIAWLNGSWPTLMLMETDILYVLVPNAMIEPIPNNSPEVVNYRQKYHIDDPQVFYDQNLCGWFQTNAGDPVMCAMAMNREDAILVTAVLGPDQESAWNQAKNLLLQAPPWKKAQKQVKTFYTHWWSNTPKIKIEHERHQLLYDYGMYRLIGFTQPGKPAPTLQGPWIEDNRMPPWKSDYHFNINVQMAHWPMLAGNHPEQFEPLGKMLKQWFPKMQFYAERFVGIRDGLMLPHACDDRCCPADTAWTCQFDIGAIGWTALIFWDLYRYYLNRELLSDLTYPLLRGALRLYETVIEQTDGESLYAPSPEYVPPNGHAWGRNPSFHLAILHRLLSSALETIQILGIQESRLSNWQLLQNKIPKATVCNHEILIWEGLPLRESHRHHSHLAGIYPFDIFDLEGKDKQLVERSLFTWTQCGTGAWTGWCITWATILWARMQNPVAAYYLLDQYDRFFVGPNNFSSHNAFHRGFTIFLNERPPYIMQMDAVCGATTAIMEMLVHEHQGKIRKAPAVPKEWGKVEFEGIRLPGNRVASGKNVTYKGGEIVIVPST